MRADDAADLADEHYWSCAMPAVKLSLRVERAAQVLHHASLRTEAVQRLVAGTYGQRTQRFAKRNPASEMPQCQRLGCYRIVRWVLCARIAL